MLPVAPVLPGSSDSIPSTACAVPAPTWMVIDADNMAPGPWLDAPDRPHWLDASAAARLLIAADRAHKIDAWLDALGTQLGASCLILAREVPCATDAADRALVATLKSWLRTAPHPQELVCVSGDRDLIYRVHALAYGGQLPRMSVCASWAMRHMTDDLGVEFWQAPVRLRGPSATDQVHGFSPRPGPAKRPRKPHGATSALRRNPHSPRQTHKRVVGAAERCGARSRWVSGAQLSERFVREGLLPPDARGKMARILALAPGVLKKKAGSDLWMLA